MNNRRTFIASIGAVGTVAIAGCSSGNSDNESTSGDEANQTGSSDGGSSSDDRTDQNSARSDPETVVRQHIEHLISGEYDAANELLHPESLGYPLDESDISITDLELSSVEDVTFDQANERVAIASEEKFDEAVQDRVGNLNWTLVLISFTDTEAVTPAVEADGGWLVLRLR